ncbi:MAG TPA: CPBP family intramembrane metalloprotease [candidate division WOR-3 bacterium]|uniref:CPBP family intramembrane metalloprotease n=1 Tax=candidate division WOR-3 bacterium TaxID=2052148 RepID=A0A7V0XFQ2_UNCW3|nr:CPBP family intramembrane metalloprotease [candidate division WOR-3 bacterium]
MNLGASNDSPSRRQVVLFLVLSFAFAWVIAGAFSLLGGRWNTPAAVPVGVVVMFTPLAATLIVQKLIRRRPLRELGLSFRLNWWWLAAWLGPPAAAFATIGVSLLLPVVEYAPGMEGMFERFATMMSPEQMAAMKDSIPNLPAHPIWLTLGQALVAGLTVNALAGFGEEVGWRGFLYRGLAPLGFWRSSLLTGFIWGIWHAPLILQGHNYPDHPVAGVAMMTAWCVLLGPPFAFIRARTGSVIAASVFHGVLNASAGIALMVVRGGSDLIVGLTGLAGFIVLAAVNLALVFTVRRGRPLKDAPVPG